MRKILLALAALLSLPSACYAAFAIFQTYSGPPQIFYNIVTDAGAVCAGDQVQVNRVITFASGSPNVSVTVNTFSAGDVGKYIIIPNANLGNNYRTIQTVTDPQHIILNGNVFATVSGVATDITYGHDDAPNFKTFNTWAVANQGTGNQVVLTIPNGKTCWFGSNQTITGSLNNSYFAGINNLIIEGTGATMSGTLGAGFFLAGNGVTEIGLTSVGGKSARLKSVSAAASTIELTATSYAAGYISRFAVGNWLMISGMDIQTGWQSNYGVPPNHQYFERRQITSICNNTGPCTGSATITLDRPLTNSYLDTWPEYYNGSAGGIDQGGPATAYILPDSWNTIVEYRGVTIDLGQSYAWGRNVTFRNVTWLGCCGTVPTQNETFTAINSTYSGGGGWEVDKLVDTVTITGGSFTRIDFQSSSVNNLVMSNASIGSMFGTPKNSQITDTTFTGTLRFGAWTNGNSTGSVVCTRCSVGTLDWDGGLIQTVGSAYSMSSGVITTLNTDETGGNGPPHRVFVPGGNVYYRINSALATVGLFQSTAITQDPTNTFTQTNEAGGFPTYSGYAGRMETHPAPRFTCDSCTGDATLVATNIQKGATALAPLGEYSSYQNVSPTITGTFGSMKVRGKIVSLTIDVGTAYTGSGSPMLFATGPFGLNTVKQSDWSTFSWNPTINIKQTGTRVITPSGVTCNGVAAPTGCAGDSLGASLPEAVWIGSGMDFGLSANLSGGINPVITITARTNQGVVP